MKEYQNYIFDLYGTLVDIHTNENKPYLWKKLSEFYATFGAIYSPKDLKKEYTVLCKKMGKNMNSPHGEFILEEVFRQLLEEKGVHVSEDVIFSIAQFFRVLSRDKLALYVGVKELLEELKAKRKKIYLLSNAQEVFTIPEMKVLGLMPYFDGIYISSVIGTKKPDTRFMDALVQKEKLEKQESIMIGNDQTTDIQIAKDFGIDSLYIHSNLSPEYCKDKKATYEILDGDVSRILK